MKLRLDIHFTWKDIAVLRVKKKVFLKILNLVFEKLIFTIFLKIYKISRAITFLIFFWKKEIFLWTNGTVVSITWQYSEISLAKFETHDNSCLLIIGAKRWIFENFIPQVDNNRSVSLNKNSSCFSSNEMLWPYLLTRNEHNHLPHWIILCQKKVV